MTPESPLAGLLAQAAAPDATVAIRARHILPLAGEAPAVGEALVAPLHALHNAVLLVQKGRVVDVLPWSPSALPAACPVWDAGPVCLAPACVNAHTHLELSHLAGMPRWGAGFAAWLQSLIPLLALPPQADTVAAACLRLRRLGTAAVGNVAGSLPDGLAVADTACREAGLPVRHFCEWFGFGSPFADTRGPWPPRCRPAIADQAGLAAQCAPGGHALYSTGPEVLQAAHTAARRLGRVFSFHLAESPEENALLTRGEGPLWDIYAQKVLPPGWTPPGLRPLAYARQLGLLTPGTLAVHGVQLKAEEAKILADSGAFLCLCPRSNHHLGVGQPAVASLMAAGCRLCLGTDGLTSNTSLDVREEAVWLRETQDVPPQALVRMLTVNGAAALGFPQQQGQQGRLVRGALARVCVLPEVLVP